MKDFLRFLISVDFLKQILLIGGFLLLVIFGVMFWLNSYTNHGQKLTMPDYTNLPLKKAISDAAEQSFSIIVTDSLHRVGRQGGIILDQNPIPDSQVKEQRKIYVTTTKYRPDYIEVKDLPLLYGTDYNQAIADLKSRSIFSKIKSKKYDAGQPNHILEVWYEGKLIISKTEFLSTTKIEKGQTLQFIISENQGGTFVIPDITCKSLADARSYMLYSKMKLGQITYLDNPADASSLWVVSQEPPSDKQSTLTSGSIINITVSSKKAYDCN